MARQELDVRMGAQAVPVGTLIFESDGTRQISTFRYRSSWLENPRGFDLAPSMPRQLAPFYGKHERNISCLPGAVEDGAPDSWGRKVIEKMSGSAHLGDLDYLTSTDDFLRMGALRYFSEQGEALAPTPEDKDGPRVPRLHNMSDVIMAARAFEANPDEYAQKRADLVGGDILHHAVGSLGGARPKVNAIDNDGALWIIKLPKQGDDYAMARAEVLALRMARDVGINAAEAYVLNDAPHFPMIRVKRFDRTGKGYTARVPYISAQTFVGADMDHIASYEEIAMLMRAQVEDSRKQIHELYRRMAFGVLVRNTDDHLRNHGFLRGATGWQLSPAFDINPEHRHGGQLQTPISEIHGSDCSISAVLDAAPYFDMTTKRAREMIGDMARYIAHNWRRIGSELQMTSRDFAAVGSTIENDDLSRAASL
ncbi:type II toxin-antitoxin system HipA family toxin [uncultured Cohaesibacter sp.]|uniref:type II toxin-antitoxin system HipA family toxin n=1 Tax=uncultured Cohaesibacter sp. TaxID=1002546 RepID=UPI002AA74B2A|nr:type II toxin-antitoxin system HipA family toxin [uncultured Cohaesibacter sp.]